MNNQSQYKELLINVDDDDDDYVYDEQNNMHVQMNNYQFQAEQNIQQANNFPQLQKIHHIKDSLALRILNIKKQADIAELANIFNVICYVNEEQSYIEVFHIQQNNAMKNNRNQMRMMDMGGEGDQGEEQVMNFIEQINQLVQQIQSELIEQSYDCNYDEYMKIKKTISNNEIYSKDFIENASLDLINVDNSYNLQSSNSRLPSVLKRYLIDNSISIKICKLDKVEQLNIHFFDFLLLNITQQGLFIDSFGLDLYKTNKQLKQAIKKAKKQLAFHDCILIEQMQSEQYIEKDQKICRLQDTFKINGIKEIRQSPITLCLQTANDEYSCMDNLERLMESIKNNGLCNHHKGFFQFGLSLHSQCGDNYLNTLLNYMKAVQKQENYFKLPSEMWILISDGQEKKVLDAMDKLTGQVSENSENKYAGYYSSLNKNKIKKFSQANQIIINKAIHLGLKSVPLIFHSSDLSFDQGQNLNNNNNGLQVDRIICDLSEMQLSTKTIDLKSPIFEDGNTYSFINSISYEQYFMEECLSKLIQTYQKLGINTFSYDFDFVGSLIMSSIYEFDFMSNEIRLLGGKTFVVGNQYLNQLFATKEIPKQNDEQFAMEEDGVMDEEEQSALQPKLTIRSNKHCIDSVLAIKQQIEKNDSILYEIPIRVKIPKDVALVFNQLKLQHKVWIEITSHTITIEGYRKTVGRLIPQIYKQLNQIQIEEEKKEVPISLGQNLQLPETWERQDENLKLVELSLNTSEAKQCIALFQKTLNRNVVSIQRVQNITLMKNYLFEKQKLQEKGNAKELLLFHGTKANDPKIIYSSTEEGFDFRLAFQGGAYGKGTYFHEMSSYSDGYKHVTQNGTNQMFLATVLVGVPYSSGPSQFTAPPYLNSVSGPRYDSVMSNHPVGQNMYIVYHNSKSYPLYLISYR